MNPAPADLAVFALDPATDIRNRHGAPGWHELVCTDPDAAGSVLSDLLGWDISPLDSTETGSEYLVARVAGHEVGGIRRPMPGEPDGPRWITYVTVTDADQIADHARKSELTVLMPPTDLGQAGRATIIDAAAAGVVHAFQYHRPFA